MADKPTYEKALAGLTRSQRQFLKAFSKSKTITDAGVLWAEMRGTKYKSRRTASSKAARKLTQIKKRIAANGGSSEELWEFLGLDAASVARALCEGMEAMKTVVVNSAKGPVEFGPLPDYPTRVAAAMHAARLRGDLDRKPPAAPEPAPFSFTAVMHPKEEGKL